MNGFLKLAIIMLAILAFTAFLTYIVGFPDCSGGPYNGTEFFRRGCY